MNIWNLIKEKIAKELCSQSKMLNREIAKVVTGTNETVVIFNNGSTIQAVNASQNTRGLRCHVLVVVICLDIHIYKSISVIG